MRDPYHMWKSTVLCTSINILVVILLQGITIGRGWLKYSLGLCALHASLQLSQNKVVIPKIPQT